MYRFGISVDEDLIEEFDKAAKGAGYVNRSEVLRDLMRQFIVEQSAQEEDVDVVGAVAMVYDHQKRELSQKLTEYQHHHHDEVIATMHIHLDKRHCLEILAVRGKSKDVRKIANGLFAKRGVLFGKLVITSISKEQRERS